MLRRCVLLLCVVPLVGTAADAVLPRRNLVVSWRWNEVADRSAAEVALRGGGVVVGTGGSVDARGAVVLRSGRGESSSLGEQQVVVLNGGRASLGLSRLVPLQWVEVAMGPKGPVGVLRQQWFEAGSRFEVSPRWPGGRAPAEVEVTLQAVAPGSDTQAPGSGTTVTTLVLPLDEWVTVAQAGESRRAHEEGALSSRDAERHSQRLLQMRVSAP